MSRISELLVQYRAFKGFNIRDFAADLGVSPATLSRIERGENMDGPHSEGNDGFREVWLCWREKKCEYCKLSATK